MTDRRATGDKLLVVIHDGTGYVHVVGRGSFKNSTALKQFGTTAIEQDCHSIVLDMAECLGMDSTFMGVLAGLAFRLKQKSDGEILMVNLSTRTRSLLATLGLDRVIRPFMAGTTPPEYQQVLSGPVGLDPLETGDVSRRKTAETMLEAHENLVDLSDDNAPKFTDVLTFLREDLKKADDDA
jgi:anti-anti-sigma factor